MFRCQRTWHNKSGEAHDVILTCELQRSAEVSFYLIPGVSYNGNQSGHGLDPKGLCDSHLFPSEGADCLAKARWIFGGHRSSLPACTITEGGGYAVGLYAAPEDASRAACWLETVASAMIHRLWWPLQEQPRTYVGHDRYAPGIRHTLHLDAGSSCTRTFFIAISRAPEPRQGYCAILDDGWAQFYHDVPARYAPQRLWALGIQFAKESLWTESSEFVGFSIGLTWLDGQWVQRPERQFEIGWCGQNAALACILLQDFLWNGNQESWQRGEAALNFWARNGRFDNGLFYTLFDDKLAGYTNPDLDTCNLGYGAYQYLLASELAEQAGRPRPLWREMGLGACDFFSSHILPDGRLGKLWKASGQVQDPEGTIGCHLIWPLVKAYRMTVRSDYLQTAECAYRVYAESDLAALCCTASALDTDCIDKESALPLLITGVDLYQITGNPYYLRQAEKAGYYLPSWQWHYSIDYPEGTPAAQMDYDTFGGTSVSVQHHHLDPWGALIALGWLRLSEVAAKDIWRERAVATWRQATIGVSDGTLSLNGKLRPAGSQDERFTHTRWGRTPGNVSNWLVAWPAAFRLLTLQHWADWKILG